MHDRVTFEPSGTGTRTAAIALTDNAAGSPHTIALSGTGTSAVAGVTPSSLAFGNQAVGTGSAAQVVTLANSGSASLNLISIVVGERTAAILGRPIIAALPSRPDRAAR